MEKDLLSQQAEEIYRRKAEKIAKIPATDIPALIEELKIHQIELELQNEELRHVQVERETALNKYFDLFDFAPIGYLTLNSDGMITEVNRTCVRLLGVASNSLLRSSFFSFYCG